MAGWPAESSAMDELLPALKATVSMAHVGALEVQVKPSPVKPWRQLHTREPTVLVQVAFTLQPPLLVRHSFTSEQVTPLPVEPEGQVQVRDPGVLVQVAVTSQPPLLARHSLTSVQEIPVPV